MGLIDILVPAQLHLALLVELVALLKVEIILAIVGDAVPNSGLATCS
jgi:hypothetical protein